MSAIAYSYTDPLLDSPPDISTWGWDVSRVYQDLGDRHQLQQLLQDCQDANGIDAVLVRHLDELGDTVEEVGHHLATLEQLGISLIATEEEIGTDDQQMKRSELLKLLKMVQTRHQTRRIRQGHARNRVKALPPPGKAPYGYRRSKDRYALDRSTAPVVKDFFDHFLLYGSLRGSVRYLERKYNKKISVSTGKRWLTSPVYRGDLVYRNGDVVPDTHIPIISRDEAAQVDRLLRRNRRLPPRTASAPRSLAGLVICAACQSSMKITRTTYRRTKKEYLYLTPVACPYQRSSTPSQREAKHEVQSEAIATHPDIAECQGVCRAVPYQDVLERTIQRICDDLPRAVAGVELPDMELLKQRIQGQMAEKDSILAQLPQLQESGILDAETTELRRYKLRTEIATLRAQLAQLPPVNLRAIAQTVSIPQFWLDLSEAERRFYFREFIRQIQLFRQPELSDSPTPERPKSSSPVWDIKLIFIF